VCVIGSDRMHTTLIRFDLIRFDTINERRN
jgi:hypothetical protein